MNLIAFHRLLIITAAVFFAGYGTWEFAAFARGAGSTHMFIAAVSFLAAVALVLYLRRLSRFLGTPE